MTISIYDNVDCPDVEPSEVIGNVLAWHSPGVSVVYDKDKRRAYMKTDITEG